MRKTPIRILASAQLWQTVSSITQSQISNYSFAKEYTVPSDQFSSFDSIIKADIGDEREICFRAQEGICEIIRISQNKVFARRKSCLQVLDSQILNVKVINDLKTQIFVLSKVENENIISIIDHFIINIIFLLFITRYPYNLWL